LLDAKNSGLGMTAEELELVGNIKVVVHRKAFSKEEVPQPRYYKGRRLRNVENWVGQYAMKGDSTDESMEDSGSESDEDTKETEDAESLDKAKFAKADEEALKGQAKSHVTA
jgi:hypothetical protein